MERDERRAGMMALYTMSASLNSKAGDHGGSAEADNDDSSSSNCGGGGGGGRHCIRPMHKRTNRGAEAVARALLARKDEHAAAERVDASAAAAAAAAAAVAAADASAARGGGGDSDGNSDSSADHDHCTPSNRPPPLKSLLTFGDVLSVLRSLPFAQNAARRNVMAEGVPWIYRYLLTLLAD